MSDQSGDTNSSEYFRGLPLVPPDDPSLEISDDVAVNRSVQKVFEAAAKSEGVGAKVRRSIGVPQLRHFTPFLMLDHFTIPAGSGFPDHPHLGQETVTYVLSGSIAHEDSNRNRGELNAGDLQFMTAGKGIVHAEMPQEGPNGEPSMGMQLWVDLPKSLKMCEPRYRDLRASEIPIDTSEDGKVQIKVIAGLTNNGVLSQQNLSYTPVWYLDVKILPGGRLVQHLPRKWNAFAYTMDGSVEFDTTEGAIFAKKYDMAVFEAAGDRVVASVPEGAKENARLILVAGLPLDQPIIQYGPFVVTKTEEIHQALADYQNKQNGFEHARNWESEIGKRMAL